MEVSNKNYVCREIPAKVARDIVKNYHYSHKVVPNSNLHLGIFDKQSNELVGALQFGPPMNPKSTPNNIAEGSNSAEMLELNRMVMADDQPRNSESQAISLCINWIRKFRKDLHYLLSFSDGKEGNVGYIYQATNWTYVGFRLSDSFYKLDGTIMHSVQVWHLYKEKHPDRDIKTTHEILFDNFVNVSKVTSKQHTYVFPLSNRYKFVSVEYPKKDTELRILKEVFLKRDGIVLPKQECVDYTKKSKHVITNGFIIVEDFGTVGGEKLNHNGRSFVKLPYTQDNAIHLNSLGYAVKLPEKFTEQ